MEKSITKKQLRMQLIVLLCTTGLFFLIFLIARLTLPAQIPSDYYADDGVYLVKNTSIQAHIFLYLILLCAFELAAFFRTGLIKTAKNLWAGRKIWLKEVLIAALCGAAGAFASSAVFSMSGKEYKEYWVILTALLLIFFELQIRLLWKKKRSFPVKKGNKEQNIFFFAAMAVLVLLIVFEWKESAAKAPEYLRSWHFLFPFFVMIAETVLACLLYQKYVLPYPEKDISYQRIFLISVFILAVAYMLVLLPYVSPDEDKHFLSAYRLSDLFLARICRFGDARLMMRTEDYLFFSGAQLKNSAQYFAQITDQAHLFLKEQGLTVTEGAMVTNAVPAYIPAALGMTVARILHLSGTMLFYFSRLGNIIFSIVIMKHVMQTVGEKKAAFFALLTMPMMLHLMASCSYDICIFCFAALFVSQTMRVISLEGEAPVREKVLLILYGALLAPCKLVYLPLLLLVLIIPSAKLGAGKKAVLWKAAVIVGGLAAILLVSGAVTWITPSSAVKSLSAGAGEGGGRILSWCQEEGYTLPLLVSNLPRVIQMCIRTAIRAFDEYFFTMIGSRLGWLEIPVPLGCLVISFMLFFFAASIRNERTIVLSGARKIWIVFLCLVSAAAVLLALTLSWTPLSYEIVAGVQGRYFLPLLIPILWFADGRVIRVGTGFQKFLLPAAAMLNIWVLAYVYAHTIMTG